MTDPLTPERLGEIRALAEAATPGEWFTDHAREVCAMLGGISPVLIAETGTSGELVVEQSEADAAFIALGPKTTLALLDALTSTRERATAWSSALETACTILGVGCGLGAFEAVEAIRRHDAAVESRATAAEARVVELEGLVAHLKESLADQAAARHDPTMPLLTEEVLEALEGDAEAQYALADTREDRVNSHGLSLLCEWQRRALAAKLKAGGVG